MISRRPTDTDRVQRLANNAMRAADRGAQLIRRLMSFARKQSLRPEILDANDTLREFAALVANLPVSATTMRLEPGEHVGAVTVDEAEFQSAFLHLVTNARDAMPEGGEIVVSTRTTYLQASDLVEPDMTPGTYVQIAIADRGVGMPPDVRSRMFEPFFTTKPRDAGTGLGLAQVYGFVRSAGGQVIADSELGLGTTIRMFLPRAQEAATPHVEAPRRVTAERPAATRSVLLVEDDHDVLEATKDRVEELGYLVITAETGDEAFELLSKGLVVDVVLSDIVMPGKLNGVQLAEAVRRIRPTQRLVLTSGYTGGALDQFQLPRGLVFLAKPYSQKDLADKLISAVD
jgi:CheY-like chemotaxis protein